MLNNIFRVLTANGIVAIVGLLSSLFLPKILTIEEYAIYQTFLLYLTYIAILHLGFPTGMNIKYAGKRLEDIDKEQYKAEIRLLLLILSVFTIVGLGMYAVTGREMQLYLSIMILFYCFPASYSALVQAWGKFDIYAILHILISAVPLIIPIIYYLVFHTLSSTICILSYVNVYGIVLIGCLIYHNNVVKGIKSASLFTNENWHIEKLGFFFLMGNYINSLLHSIDKQFVKWFCITSEFSYYSFGLTMQGAMTMFITAISQPLFPYMASGKLQGIEQYTTVKRLLLMLGSLSGLAYFACALVVRYWLPNYSYSLSVIRVYFAVFPAMAVINCLYFNLYKLRRMTDRYIVDLVGMFIAAVFLNYIAVVLETGYIGIAIATTFLNYLWLLYGTFIFKELKLTIREILFIIIFIIEFYAIPQIETIPLGALVYLITNMIVCFLFFKKELNLLINKFAFKKTLV